MCGIAGVVGLWPNAEATVERMLIKQQHRGPDARQLAVINPEVVLGHNRLSIIDLSNEANQPMASANGRFTIVFNGEIYNYLELKQLVPSYPFRTKSDTEVLLALYEKFGAAMLDKLNGMFAFAIWDNQEQLLFAARDRFGVKPFYYVTDTRGLLFASEIPTLFAAGIAREPNMPVWVAYLSNGSYGSGQHTFWRQILQLPAGSTLTFSKGQLKISSWYNFVEAVNVQAHNATLNQYWEQEYRAILNDAVALRFRADVPVGFNISGGLDSSTLLALVNSAYPGGMIEAFTFTTGHPQYDELPWVEAMIAQTGNPLHNCELQAAEVPELAATISSHQMEPYGGLPTIAYSNLFMEARKRGIIVLLDGQGMDEAWAGYDYYLKGTNSVVQGVSSSPLRADVLLPSLAREAFAEHYPKPFESRIQNLQYRDLFYTKIPRALRFNDRVSMLHSTELREPFLDYRLVEIAFARRDDEKIRNGQQKWMLRQIAAEKLGNSIALAPKRPVQTPQREWLRNELKDWAQHHIDLFSNYDFVDKAKVKKYWNEFLNSDAVDNSFFVWQWINTALILQ